MRLGLSWLREYVDLPAELSAEAIDEALNNLGIEVESIVDQRDTVKGSLVVGRVSSIEELSEFKKPIRFCLVDVGNPEPRRSSAERATSSRAIWSRSSCPAVSCRGASRSPHARRTAGPARA